MSSKKKGSLLNRVLGKGKEDEEGGAPKSKKGKKNKLEKQPSIRESVHSERAPTMHSVTHHGSEALQYEEHHGAPVTAVHEEDPYSPFDEGASYMHMREPSNIHIRPESNAHHNNAGYFDEPFSQSPRGTVVHHASVHENSAEHVETAHPNVISLGGQGHGHAQPDEHVAFAGVSRQPTILSPHQSAEAPRMLKPGDQMEIDPRNPPTFVVDEGVTLEIGDEEHGFVPYEQYLANLANQPPPTTGGTYIVQGGGDVVIQDEHGHVIKTIPGTGANAGRGEPQIHHPPHIVPILVSLSRRAAKPRCIIQSKQRNNQGPILITKAPVRGLVGGLASILEPAGMANSFSSLFDLVDPIPRRQEISDAEHSYEGAVDESTATTEAAIEEKLPVPTRPIPPTPTTATLEVQSPFESHQLGQAMHREEVYSEPPLASPASIKDFDELEDVDSDLALIRGTPDVAKTPKMSPGKGITVETGTTLVTTTFPRIVEGRSPVTPVDELSDMSEIILSPVRTRSLVSNTTSSQNSPSRSDDLDHPQETLPAPWAAGGPRLYGFQGDFAVPTAPVGRDRNISGERDALTAPARQGSPTLTHSQAEDVDEDQEIPRARPSPPPRPARSPNRPSSSSRDDSLSSIPALPLPPPSAILRQTHRNPIPIPTSTFPTEKSTQPRLNPSPKILAMIQKFEGNSRETEDLGNVFVGSTRSLSISPSRRGSVSSSSKMEYNYSSPWTSYNTPPSSRPDTPNSVSEFGEQIYPDGGPSNMEIARGMEVRWRGDGRTSDMVNQANWDLRHTTTRRGSMPKTSRPSMTPAIPGWEVQPELIRELSQKRLRRAE